MGRPPSVHQKPEKREKDHLSTAVSYGSVLTPETTIVSVFKNSCDGKSGYQQLPADGTSRTIKDNFGGENVIGGDLGPGKINCKRD